MRASWPAPRTPMDFTLTQDYPRVARCQDGFGLLFTEMFNGVADLLSCRPTIWAASRPALVAPPCRWQACRRRFHPASVQWKAANQDHSVLWIEQEHPEPANRSARPPCRANGSTAGAGNNDFQSTVACRFCIGEQLVRGAMGRNDLDFIGDTQLIQHVGGGHGRPVRPGSHYDPYQRLHVLIRID